MGIRPSNRAEILKLVLSHINNRNYDFEGRYIIFGASSVWDMMMDLTDPHSERENHSVEGTVNRLASDLKIHAGRVQAAGRTSLGQLPKFKTNAFHNLPPEKARVLHDLLEEALQEKIDSAEQPRTPSESEVADALDAAFAEEVLGKLPKIVSRASVLDTVDLPGVPDDVRQYFEEAHRTFLYGFRIACAVLCRAILESALKAKVDPKGIIESSLSKGQSYLLTMVSSVETLKDDLACVEDVRKAGGLAIHDIRKFNNCYGGEKLDEVLVNTRKVLVDLYAS